MKLQGVLKPGWFSFSKALNVGRHFQGVLGGMAKPQNCKIAAAGQVLATNRQFYNFGRARGGFCGANIHIDIRGRGGVSPRILPATQNYKLF